MAVHAVCVWEYESRGGFFLPYSPAASQHLERAYAKKLTRVLLSDADPSFDKSNYVNMTQMTMTQEESEAAIVAVRRIYYLPSSPAGKGTKWEWSVTNSDNAQWHPYNMHVQCIIEEAWAKGEQTLDLCCSNISLPYIINFCNLTQTLQPNGPIRSIRRTLQAPYPLVKLTPQQALQLNTSNNNYKDYVQKRTNTLPKAMESQLQRYVLPQINRQQQQHHHQHHQQQQPQQQPQQPQQSQRKSHKKHGEISTTNLRQILNNLNIFGHSSNSSTKSSATAHPASLGGSFSHGHKNKPGASMHSDHSSEGSSLQSSQRSGSSRVGSHRSRSRTRASTDTNSIKSQRRPSVDTVSTYLSKESLRSRNFAISVNDLLDCSLGSDDVFTSATPSSTPTSLCDRPPAPPPLPTGGSQRHQAPLIAGAIVGVDAASDMISRFVKVVEPPQWPNAQPCPMCLQELVHSAQNPSIALSRCQHLMHLQCLNGMIIAQQSDLNKNLFIECPVCGIVYGEKVGNQPSGIMSWSIISKCLPGHDGQNTIQIVYDIASGIQTAEHPHPGRAFFAVGFPRVCYLPDCPLGRKVLRFLKIAFDRQLLFSIGRSVTTGREDVVIWNSVDHKTQFNMFPDPTYLQRCMQQLVHLGVTD